MDLSIFSNITFDVLIFILAYSFIVIALKSRIEKNKNFSLMGPFLMIKSVLGINLIQRIGSHKRLWHGFGILSILLVAILMPSIFVLLVVEALIVYKIPASKAPQPTELIGIPGINPFIPVIYGIIALIVAVVIHELFHGFVAKSNGMSIKSTGILYFIVPIGAFVELDEEHMKKISKKPRSMIAAAGPGINFVLAFVFLMLFFGMVSTTVVPAYHNGMGVYSVYSNSAAQHAGIVPGDILISINNVTINNDSSLEYAINSTKPGMVVGTSYWDYNKNAVVTQYVTMTNKSLLTGNLNNKSLPFFGVSVVSTTGFLSFIKNPFNGNFIGGFVLFIALPFLGMEPIAQPLIHYYTLQGPLAFLPLSYFWFGVNLFYWLFWMNLMLSLTNALPAVPLDGSYVYKDGVSYLLEKLFKKIDAIEVDKISNNILVITSFLVFFLIIWQLIGPHII